jgi:hypothetical protein
MTLNAGNVSLLLTLLSTVAPGTWAIVAGVGGIAVGFFGKKLLKKNDCPSYSGNTKPSNALLRRDPTSRLTSPKRRKKNPASGGD